MKRISCLLLCIFMCLAFVGCDADLEPKPIQSQLPTQETATPSPEPTVSPTPEPTPSARAGVEQEVEFGELRFTYNDKYDLEQSADGESISILFIPSAEWMKISKVPKLDALDSLSLEEQLRFHVGASTSGFDSVSNEQIGDIQVAGVPGAFKSAIVKSGDHYVNFTAVVFYGEESGYVIYYYNIFDQTEGLETHAEDFGQIAESIVFA